MLLPNERELFGGSGGERVYKRPVALGLWPSR